MLVLLIALTLAADDDLCDLKIPADAIARPGSFRPDKTLKKKLDYFVGADLVGARVFYADGQVAVQCGDCMAPRTPRVRVKRFEYRAFSQLRRSWRSFEARRFGSSR